MPLVQPNNDIVLRMLEAIGLHALNEQTQSSGSSGPRNANFEKLVGMSVTETALRQLQLRGVSVLGHCCIPLPRRTLAGTSWAGLLWVAETNQGDHRLQVVMVGNGRPFGYRWEPPEGIRSPHHNYWHAQPITAVRTANTDMQLGIESGCICTHMPTFPIDAPDALSMLDALLVSIYGPGYLELYILDAQLRASVRTKTLNRSWAASRIAGSSSATVVGTTKKLPKGIRRKRNKN
jgi:hypothetical protein